MSEILQLRPTAHRVLHKGRLVLEHRERRAVIQPYDGMRRHLMELLAKGISPVDLDIAMVDRFGPDAAQEAAAILRTLVEADVVRRLKPAPSLPPRFERTTTYLSQFADASIDEHELIDRVSRSVVVVVGVGGLGSWLVSGLACLGVGTLRLVDFDVVEASNLNRTLLIGENDVGSSKVDAMAQRVAAVTSQTRVTTFPLNLATRGLSPEIVSGADVVLSTADKPAWVVRGAVAETCLAAGVPFLCPSGFRVGPFFTGSGDACAMCEYTRLSREQPAFEDIIAAQVEVPPSQPGSVPHVAASAAAVVLQDVLRLLTGIESPATRNRVWCADWNLGATFRDCLPEPGCVCQAV